jgi:heat shock protein HslJ
VVETGAGEPACCGTQLARKRYSIEAHTLTPVDSRVTGALSLAAASGVTWKLIAINGRPLSSPGTTLVFDSQRVSGSGGCNRYSGRVAEHAPGQIAVSELASTKMACAEAETEIETRFLAALAETRAYTFLAGRLGLSTSGRRGTGLLLFERER